MELLHTVRAKVIWNCQKCLRFAGLVSMVLKNVLLAHPTVWLGVTYKFSFKEDKANYLPVNPIEEQLERMQTAFEDLDANQIQLATLVAIGRRNGQST